MPPNQTVDFSNLDDFRTQHVLPNEIKGVDTWLISVPKGETFDLSVEATRQVIHFFVNGVGEVSVAGRTFTVDPKCLFVPKPGSDAVFTATAATVVLKVAMDLRAEESERLMDATYPLFQKYAECEKYRDYFKSEKTVSRTLIHPFTLPRFCMGSVETSGPDRIEPHAHAMLDQLFFSFSENSCTLLIDGETFRYGGNNLLHIPLGSEHGVDAVEGDVVHYLWLDFFEDEKEQQYLVDVHKPIKE